jgi:hypothetical protein
MGMTSTRCHPQITHPDQVVGRKCQHKLKIQFLAANEPALAQPANRLDPAKTVLDPLAKGLAHLITRMAGGTPING